MTAAVASGNTPIVVINPNSVEAVTRGIEAAIAEAFLELPVQCLTIAENPAEIITADHIAAFFQGVETREHVVEDEVFGNNAAIACHMANASYFHKGVATWDAAAQNIKV